MTNSLPEFPLKTVDATQKFNVKLESDAMFYVIAKKKLHDELKSTKGSTGLFARRRDLKSLIFSDALLKKYTWKIATDAKKNRFCTLTAIIRLFVDVFNYGLESNVSQEGSANTDNQEPESEKSTSSGTRNATEEDSAATDQQETETEQSKSSRTRKAKKRMEEITFDIKQANLYFMEILKRKESLKRKNAVSSSQPKKTKLDDEANPAETGPNENNDNPTTLNQTVLEGSDDKSVPPDPTASN
ncbi:uncharacterized protein LOC116346513 [Contarinia nasturtii]|uniref:uncharacterized protein LOC116346513 n=1 Tax=Contarinia nasturtii TaxID=265458 RepID=UPI0012D40A68|nr:uncharacterized protein LOC116346513 [Contarinia nasturtii]